MEHTLIKGFRKVCPHCGKIIESLSANVVKHNYEEHLRTCKIRKEIKLNGVKK